MKPWGWAGAALVFCLGAFGAFWLEHNGGLIRLADEQRPAQHAVDAAVPHSASKASPRQPAANAVNSGLPTQLAGEFLRVADIYEQTSRFPTYSFPISEAALVQFQYNRYIPVTVPLQQPGGEGEAEIRVVLEKLHFEKGEPIVGLAAVFGADAADVTLSRVELLNRADETLASTGLAPAGPGEYPIRLTTSAQAAEDWPSDLLLRVEGSWDRQSVAAVAPVFLDDPIGGIESVGEAYVDGAHLWIPVELELDGPGFYVLSGNLYSQEGKPLVHIEHQAELSRFDNKTKLRVHRQALEATGNEGPYELRDLMVRQLPSRPGDRTRFGPVLDKTVDIPRFSFDQYSSATYEDPLRAARLEFLRSAAAGPEGGGS